MKPNLLGWPDMCYNKTKTLPPWVSSQKVDTPFGRLVSMPMSSDGAG